MVVIVRTRDRLGAVTDAMVQPASTSFIDRSSYRLVRTDEHPGYHYGNYLLLDYSPSVRELDHWFEKCRYELADVPIRRLILQWETDLDQLWGGIRELDDSLYYVADVVMSSTAAPAPVPGPDGVTLRPLESARDWDDVVELSKQVSEAMSGAAFASFARWRYAQFRQAAEAGRCRFWGAFAGDTLLASLGLFQSPSLLRFQEVQTHTGHQRKGICRALCVTALGRAFADHPSAQAIIVAAEASPARRLYERLGFSAVGLQHNLQRSVD
jgi:ribosomal protein S18 acetylase RimI-like enzyme